MALRVASRMLIRSMVNESTKATAEASAVSRISSASFNRRRGVRVLESLIPGGMRWGFMITAAAQTGPNKAPRPTSSNPATLR